ncbi:hypothetical protein PsYK624_100290 [Phanerochaete sordida]|uniref:Uncharacterized protein n=1 Tax=Phanerochaete sordida TaxID=48140 RepID=A0A9P3LGQ0_9APHY|nr:hypothetical protein PsYK624_100290 [Phanerochaete sordida]
MPYSSQQHLSDKSRPIYKRMRRRAKHREHFFDHPKYAEGHPDAFAGAGRTHDKVKVWCKRCFQARLAYERTRDALAGTLRADTAIIEHMWDTQPPEAGWIPGRPANCLVHLRDCELQDSHVREEAGALHANSTRARRRSPRRDSEAPAHRDSPRAARRGTPTVDLPQAAEAGPSRAAPYDDLSYPLPTYLPALMAQAAPLHTSYAAHYGPYSTYPSNFQDQQPQWDGGMVYDRAGRAITAAALPQEAIGYSSGAMSPSIFNAPSAWGDLPGAELQQDYVRLPQSWEALPFHPEMYGPSFVRAQHTGIAPQPPWHGASSMYRQDHFNEVE